MMKTINSIFKTFLVTLLLVAQIHFVSAQTAALLPVSPQQFFDKNGNPASSGEVGYYVPGTTTLKQVWQDDNQITPWTNPINLNAGGWPPNNKGIYGNGVYRQIVKDKNGIVISDQPTSATGSGGGSGTKVGDGANVGTVMIWSGMIAPNQYQFAYGQALSRASYPELFQAITMTSKATCVAGNTTLTGLTDTSNIPIGAKVEGSCLSANTTVVSKTLNTVVLSIAAIVSTSTEVIFFPFGSTSSLLFNVPDLRGKVVPGRTNMGGVVAANLTSPYYGSDPNAIGANGGSQSRSLIQANLPNVAFTVDIPAGQGRHLHSYYKFDKNLSGSFATTSAGYGAQVVDTTSLDTLPAMTGTAYTGGQYTPFSIVPPSITLNYIIKVTPDISASELSGVASIGGMQGVIACGTGITCVGNTISSTGGIGRPGGANGSIQYNKAGEFDGFVASGDATINTTTGVVSLVSGIDTNVYNNQTSAYTIQPSDCKKTIVLSGGFFTVTLPAVTGFNPTCSIVIKNNDVRGKRLNGFPSDQPVKLWPSQSLSVKIENGVWQTFNKPGRWVVNGDTTFYVNASIGNNNGDGLASDSFALGTIQGAWDEILKSVDGNGFDVTISVANGTYNSGLIAGPSSFVGFKNVNVVGNVTTPTNIIFSPPSSGTNFIEIYDQASLNIRGFSCDNDNINYCIIANKGKLTINGNMTFGTASSHVRVINNSTVNINSSYTIKSGAFSSHLAAIGGANINYNTAGTITISGTPTLTENFAATAINGNITLASGVVFSGAVSGGQKYKVELNGVIYSAGAVFPGSASGQTLTGGQYQ